MAIQATKPKMHVVTVPTDSPQTTYRQWFKM